MARRKPPVPPPADPGEELPAMPQVKGRTEPYPILLDCIAAIDLDVQKLKWLGENNPAPLGAREAGSLANYARVLPDLSAKLLDSAKKQLEGMDDKDLRELAKEAVAELQKRGVDVRAS